MGQAPNTLRTKLIWNENRGQYRNRWVVMKQSFASRPGNRAGSFEVVYSSKKKKNAEKKARKVAKDVPKDVTGVLKIYTKKGRLSEETRYD